MKQCTKCKQDKPVEAFCKHRGAADGLNWHCKECAAISVKRYKEKNPDYVRSQALKYKFGLTLERYNEMVEDAGGVCSICKRPERRTANGKVTDLAVDHDHATGAVRGILCSSCNVSLGGFEDSKTFLQEAINYLEKYND